MEEMNIVKKKYRWFRMRCFIKGEVKHYYNTLGKPKYNISNSMKFTISKKNMYKVVTSLRNVKKWLFITKDMFYMEIDSPTLDNLMFYKNLGMFYVIKGFKNPIECNRLYQLHKKMIFNTFACITSLTSQDFIAQSLISIFQGEDLPSDNEINDEIEENRLVSITNDEDIKLLKKRETTQGKFFKYMNILNRFIMKMNLFGRLYKLELVLESQNNKTSNSFKA